MDTQQFVERCNQLNAHDDDFIEKVAALKADMGERLMVIASDDDLSFNEETALRGLLLAMSLNEQLTKSHFELSTLSFKSWQTLKAAAELLHSKLNQLEQQLVIVENSMFGFSETEPAEDADE